MACTTIAATISWRQIISVATSMSAFQKNKKKQPDLYSIATRSAAAGEAKSK